MVLLTLAYLGGVLTIISPCILPVLPFVFARADRPFLCSGSTSSSARTAPSPTAPSRSAFSIPASKPMLSPSADRRLDP